jgi:predicted nucleotidyltransferase
MKTIDVGLSNSDLKDIIAIFKKKQEIIDLILFGSRAKGTFETGSDIDLAIKGENLKQNDFLDLLIDLDNLNLPYRFDLVIYERINSKPLLEHINRVGISLYYEKE